jgi:hypothetical protein
MFSFLKGVCHWETKICFESNFTRTPVQSAISSDFLSCLNDRRRVVWEKVLLVTEKWDQNKDNKKNVIFKEN